MSVIKSVVKFLSDTKAVSAIDQLEPGRAGAEGIVRIGSDGPLISPVHGRHCVAFFYKAFHLVGARGGGMPQPRQLRVDEVYHTFDLEMDGGRIHAVPKKSDDFSADDHKELSGMGYDGFRATEDLVSAGNRVRIYGTAKRDGDDWTLIYNKLELVQEPGSGGATPAVTSGKRKKKKGGGKGKRKKK